MKPQKENKPSMRKRRSVNGKALRDPTNFSKKNLRKAVEDLCVYINMHRAACRTFYYLIFASLLALGQTQALTQAAEAGDRPNILFIIIDDHPAHMVSVLNESMVQTPNMERLAERGTWFTRGYNAAPVCSASRAAFITGVHPANSGVYNNPHGWKRNDQPISEAESIHGIFLRNGYLTAGFGKIDHTPWQWDTLDDFTPGYRVGHRNDPNVESYTDAQLAQFIIPETLRVPMPDRLSTRFGALPDDWDLDDPKKMQEDTQHANRAIAFLEEEHGQPFFLTVGFWRPHTELIVPQRYFNMYPLDEIETPAGYKEDDLDDVPEPGRFWATRLGIHDAIIEAGLFYEYLRAFYAATTYIDEQIGRVLDALDASPYADNTIIVFASDNGFHGGEKNHWSKFALWDQTNRVAFSISVPGYAQQYIDTPVSLLDIYPTLLTLSGLEGPTRQELDGIDLTPVLKGEATERGKPVLSTYLRGNHSVRDNRFRYIRYNNGDEELYDHDNDPYEWTNLANNPEYESVKEHMRQWLPKRNAPAVPRGIEWARSQN